MNSLATAPPAARVESPLLDQLPEAPDYCSRALDLYPRLERGRLARIRHNPGRVAALISRRTTLSCDAILELLGASSADAAASSRDH